MADGLLGDYKYFTEHREICTGTTLTSDFLAWCSRRSGGMRPCRFLRGRGTLQAGNAGHASCKLSGAPAISRATPTKIPYAMCGGVPVAEGEGETSLLRYFCLFGRVSVTLRDRSGHFEKLSCIFGARVR